MNFKYKNNMLEISIENMCPPVECTTANIQAYRFTYELITDEKNFQPAYIKKPKRFNDKSDLDKCSALGISLYQSEEHATLKFNSLKNNIQNIGKTIGTHLAKGIIQKDFGVITSIDTEGHFDLHESEECNLQDEFAIIKKLI